MSLIEQVKELRSRTGVGYGACKEALVQTDGDIEKAIDVLRANGADVSLARQERKTEQGAIGSYIHTGGQLGALVELRCETDFTAKTKEFQEFAADLAMQVVAMDPKWIDISDIPTEVVEREKTVLYKESVRTGKPDHIIAKIVDGRMIRFYKKFCFLHQPFIKNEDVSVQENLNCLVSAFGEQIVIAKYVRFQIGD